jgi:DNA-directed RNA polymerase sigma subunit (sigma70/sigma32)
MRYKDEEWYNTERQIQNNNNYMSQHEVAVALGLSRHTINKVEQKALRKLKHLINEKYKKEDFV